MLEWIGLAAGIGFGIMGLVRTSKQILRVGNVSESIRTV